MVTNLVEYLTVAMIIFIIGVLGIFLNRKNIIIMLMSIELILLAINFNFIIRKMRKTFYDDFVGQIYSLFILTVAAAESAIGLAILVAYYRIRGTIAVRYINLMRG